MDIDHALLGALQQYGGTRRRLRRAMSQSVGGATPYSTEALGWIALLDNPNVTALAEAMGQTRGGASKGVSKLRDAGLVEGFMLPDNRKEIYLRLTPEGEALHARLLAAQALLERQELQYFETLDERQKRDVLRFVEGFTAYLSRLSPPEEDEDAQNGEATL